MARGGGVDLMGVGEAAELLGISDARVRQLRLAGRFIAEARTISGRRVYRRIDVLRYKRERVAKRKQG